MFIIRRLEKNPILSPTTADVWRSYAVFNPSPARVGKGIDLVFRAVAEPRPLAPGMGTGFGSGGNFFLSTIARATSHDGLSFSDVTEFITPQEPWERYGCEDPRVTYFNGTYYIFYTALSHFPFSADGIKVAVALSKDLKMIDERHLVTPFNAKAMTLFPEKIGGKITAVLTVHTDSPPSKTALIQFDSIEQMWSEEYWRQWYEHSNEWTFNLKRAGDERVEIGSAPLKTPAGWLIFYSHIRHYYSDSQKIFGIEAVLLDLKNPRKIVGRTRGPLLVPEETYERYGTVPGVVFPSGSIIVDDQVRIYYGGADTVCAAVQVSLNDLLATMKGEPALTRFSKNPILTSTNNVWEKRAVFNPAAISIEGTTHLFYRAMSLDNTSTIGHARMRTGTQVDLRDSEPAYKPSQPFEMKRIPNGNSGCEDPRVTQIGDRIYMCYTAYNGVDAPAVALTSTSIADFKIAVTTGKWQWQKPVLISPRGVDDKDACVIHTAHRGTLLFHRINNAICVSPLNLNQLEPVPDYQVILEPRPGMWDGHKIGLNAPPMLVNGEDGTPAGWLLIYHGIAGNLDYRLGFALLDANDPTKVLARTTDWVFEPEMKYEKEGQVANVVFPCGAVIRDDTLYIYYGGADSVCSVATGSVKRILEALRR